jgi:hypothetical protein
MERPCAEKPEARDLRTAPARAARPGWQPCSDARARRSPGVSPGADTSSDKFVGLWLPPAIPYAHLRARRSRWSRWRRNDRRALAAASAPNGIRVWEISSNHDGDRWRFVVIEIRKEPPVQQRHGQQMKISQQIQRPDSSKRSSACNRFPNARRAAARASSSLSPCA